MPEWNPIAKMCVTKPSFHFMNMAYNDYKVDNAPCKAGVTNQCAVRMSVALNRCGFDLEAFKNQKRIHKNRKSCKLTVPHVLGARELAKYLSESWGPPIKFAGGGVESAPFVFHRRKGVIYFDNCFIRKGQTKKTGDHIDLWTGITYYNEIIKVSAGGSAQVGTPLFGESKEVWFFPLAG
ncbi:MAG: hypothetical protein DWQ47_16430 [Acidobacteria bacterium]|nr:MAG: hypothetical protein DWQ32_03830 [Acidobacteriota bacterium]REK02361.1 MAG: hypothetical protein DWQ38_08310 [Acidobacteriota bacterium]REK13837.1 MAG: hypothetical protein DWQ43_09520 [Acidobacteriota bacterium]REK41832.1 MAG: hypothetical protein DWQ47_16430 [Acidobacteriota bacterium]